MGKLTDEQKANLSEEVIAKAMQCETPEQLVLRLILTKWTTSNSTANNLKRSPAAGMAVTVLIIDGLANSITLKFAT